MLPQSTVALRVSKHYSKLAYLKRSKSRIVQATNLLPPEFCDNRTFLVINYATRGRSIFHIATVNPNINLYMFLVPYAIVYTN